MTPGTMISTAIAALALATAPAAAKEAKPEQVMQATGECVYVVNVAESNGARFKYGSAKWTELLTDFSGRYGLDAKKYVDRAKAKYRKRARVLGADKALSDMVYTARSCQKQLEGL